MLVAYGLIPAHAGKTRRFSARSRQVRAHPRSRGENQPNPPRSQHQAGSSPLTRGKRKDAGAPQPRRGLIPAHAGKTDPGWPHRGRSRAHPRSRGENSRIRSASLPAMGSSPLTRGKPDSSDSDGITTGLIPAHAGKTRGATNDARRRGAHPRSRGENTFAAPMMFLTWGSSPLTRGKRRQDTRRARCAGLIPAHAGKTRGREGARVRPGAHPRSRGENSREALRRPTSRGSSPLTRGKRRAVRIASRWPGLIPAHAGKTI